MISKIAIANALIGLFILVIIFHLLVLVGVVPYTEVWGGRLETRQDMYRFETVSILINGLILVVLTQKRTHLIQKISSKVVNILIWIFMGLFILNTAGNIFAVSWIEKLVFTPITFLSAIALYYINR